MARGKFEVYEALVSADIVADDTDEVARQLVALFDLPQPRPSAFMEPAGHGFRAVWLRAQPSLAVAPTRIEVIGPRPRDEPHDFVEERISVQGDRPVRTHATVLAGDVPAVVEHLQRKRVRHRVSPPAADIDFPRVWVGVTAEDPLAYDPDVDAGLWLEIVPAEKSGIPATVPARLGSAAPELGKLGVRRVRARRFLVADVEASVRCLCVNLGLEPASIDRDGAGCRATYAFGNPRSAALELCQPSAESSAGEFHRRWGPGPEAIVVEVGDLEHMAALLEERQVATRFGTSVGRAPVLHVDPARTHNVPFELMETGS
jgi:hypothetical protein